MYSVETVTLLYSEYRGNTYMRRRMMSARRWKVVVGAYSSPILQ